MVDGTLIYPSMECCTDSTSTLGTISYDSCETTGGITFTYPTTASNAKTIYRDWKLSYDCAGTASRAADWKLITDTATTCWKIVTKDYCTTPTSFTHDWNTNWYDCRTPRKSASEKLRDIIRDRQSPLILTSRKSLNRTNDPKEIRARQTLHRVLGDEKFRLFIKNGFVTVRGKSGLHYQIYPGHGMTKVYDCGEHTETLCVVMRGKFPPTDSLIMRYLLILNSETEFRSHAISHKVHPKKQKSMSVDDRSLTDIFRELRVA